jgi:hypothetical protein
MNSFVVPCYDYSLPTPLISPNFCILHSSNGVHYVLHCTCLTIADLEDEPAICAEDMALGDQTSDIPIKGKATIVRYTWWIAQERRGILKVSHRSVELGILVPRYVGRVGSDNVEWPPRGQRLDESRGVSHIGMQGKENIFGGIGEWGGRTC